MYEPPPIMEQLSKLATHGIQFEGTGGGSKKNMLGPQAVSAALSGLPEGPVALALVKYAGHDDRGSLDYLVALVTAYIYQLAEQEKWRCADPKTMYKRLAMQALEEIEIQPRVCRTCLGRGSAIVKKLKVVCLSCNGTGKRSPTHSERARKLGINRNGLRNRWASRLDAVKRELVRWEYEAAQQVRHKLVGRRWHEEFGDVSHG